MRASWMLPVCLFSASCAGKNDDTSGEKTDDAACIETVASLSVEEESPIGFSAQQILALTSGYHDATLSWDGGGTAALALNISYLEGDVRFVDREVNTGRTELTDTAVDSGELCPDTVEVDVSVSAVSDDGALAESWDTALVAADKSSASFRAEFDPLAMSGSYDITPALEGLDYDEVTAYADGAISGLGTSGVISAQASGTDDCPDSADCTAWATQINIGTWTDAEE